MKRTVILITALLALVAFGMFRPIMSGEALSWWGWHGDKQDVEQAVTAAINAPGGGDYAKAVDTVKKSDFPSAVKQFQIGQLIVDGVLEGSRKRPRETLEQGLRMMEDAAVSPGQRDESNVQQLRFLFERGGGKPPLTFPTDAAVAACWLSVERDENDDRARCIALRRQRLPHVGL